MKKRILSMVLAVMLILSIMPVVFADEQVEYYKAYDIVVSKDNGISFKFKMDQTGHDQFTRCDMEIKAGSSSTDPESAFPGLEMPYQNCVATTNGGADLDVDRTNDIVSITIHPDKVNAPNLDADHPYVWLYIRPCYWANALDTLDDGKGFYYDDIVYLGKYASVQDFKDVKEEKAGTVTIESATGGSVSVAKSTKYEGETVTLNVYPNTGYQVNKILVDGTELVPVNGVYSFSMPAHDVTVTPSFKEKVTIPTEIQNAKAYAKLTLAESLDVAFSMKKATAFTDEEFGKITVFADSAPVSVSLMDGNIVGTLFTKNPAGMAESVHVLIKYDGAVVKEFDYSIRKYCESAIAAAGSSAALVNLCTATLNYGAWAQKTFDVNPDTLPNVNVTDNTASVVLPDNLPAVSTNKIDGITGISLYTKLDSKIKLVIKFRATEGTLSLDNLEVKNDLGELVRPESLSLVYENGSYYLTIGNRGANKMNRYYTVSQKDSEEALVTCGIYNYLKINATVYKDDENMVNFCKAVYAYSEAAAAYAK